MSVQRHDPANRKRCNCGWEARFGHGVAATLAVFEAKRLLALVLELFADWPIVRFAGGSVPVVFTLAGSTIGLPVSLIAVRKIRGGKGPGRDTKNTLKVLLIAVTVCAVINCATLASIGHHVNVGQKSLIEAFNGSMRNYPEVATVKRNVDQIQFVLECCGHTSYHDWFIVDWQVTEEEVHDRSVPFSCCDLDTTNPCLHAPIVNTRTINTRGCAPLIRSVILRIVVVGCLMTGTLMITQLLLALLIAKIAGNRPGTERNHRMTVMKERETGRPESASHRFTGTQCQVSACLQEKRRRGGGRKGAKSTRYAVGSRNKNTRQLDTVVARAARIRPSLHEQHTISKKRTHGPQ